MVLRTRACKPCRARKVHCDESIPYCKQCIRLGRTCSGSVESLRFVDLTEKTAEKVKGCHVLRKERHSPAQQSINLHSSNAEGRCKPLLEDSDVQLGTPRILNTTSTSVLAPITPLSHAPFLTQKICAKFLDDFANAPSDVPGGSWIHQIPSQKHPPGALGLAMQAVSMGFCGWTAAQPAYTEVSMAIYGQALEYQANKLARLTKDSVLNDQTICTTLMLGFYEGMYGTEPEGYLQHVEGATRMIELVGPLACEEESINGLFFAARTQMLLVSFLTMERSLFVQEGYLNVPCWKQEMPAHERLLKVITLLVEELNHPSPNTMLAPPPVHNDTLSTTGDVAGSPGTGIDNPLDQERNQTISKAPSPHGVRSDSEQTLSNSSTEDPEDVNPENMVLSNINQKINKLWHEFEHECLSESSIRWSPLTRSYIYPSVFAAYITSYFDLARFLSSLIHLRVSTKQTQAAARESTAAHPNFFSNHTIKQASASILSCAQYIETQNLGCAFIRLVLPLLVLGLHGIDAVQRLGAVQVLERWRDKGVVSGLAELALTKIRSQEA